jgi:hypothetical protein
MKRKLNIVYILFCTAGSCTNVGRSFWATTAVVVVVVVVRMRV